MKKASRAGVVAILGLAGLGARPALAVPPELSPIRPAASEVEGYPSAGGDALFRGAQNRWGGCSGGFGDELSVADVAYRLGTGEPAVPEALVEELLVRSQGQIGLTGDGADALRRLLTEGAAFAAWRRFFADGGRVQPFRKIDPAELSRLPPSRLSLMGRGRYMADRLAIFSNPDEPSMEEFLFHEIQHYVFDKWDSPLFEASQAQDADHEVIEILEERRRIVQAVRAGRIPREGGSGRLLRDHDGVASELLGAGRGTEAVERAGSAAYYHDWVDATAGRILARSEANRRLRMVSMPLSDGRRLLLDERSDRDAPDEIAAVDARIPPDYRFGPVVYVSLADVGRFDSERLFSEGGVPEADRQAVLEFVGVHREDPQLGRGYVFDDAQLREVRHLSAYNAAIFRQALSLAELLRQGAGRGLEEEMQDAGYQLAFSRFVRRFADRMAEGPAGDPGEAAAAVAAEILPRIELRSRRIPEPGPQVRSEGPITAP